MAETDMMFDSMMQGSIMPGALGATIQAFFFAFLLLMVALYVYNSLAIMAIAKKTGTKNAWLAWIPIANVYLMTQMAGVSGLWTLGLLAAFIPFFGTLLLVAGFLYLWWQISPKIGRPSWWAILLLIPIANLVVLGMMAWGNPSASAPAAKKAPARKKK